MSEEYQKITIQEYLEYQTLKQELQETREQLKSANIVIHHVVYNTKDSQSLAYEYLEANLLLKDKQGGEK